MNTGTSDSEEPLISGLHYVRIPVSDPWFSRDWYVNVLGFVAVLDVEEEASVTGVVLRHPSGFTIGLHHDAPRAHSLKGFSILGLSVQGIGPLSTLVEHLDKLGVKCSPLLKGHLGTYIDIPDPDGIFIRIHTGTAPDAEEA